MKQPKNTDCKISKLFCVGSFLCCHECKYFREATRDYVFCKPSLSLRIMSFLEKLKTDKFRRNLLIWIFGFCSGGVFMAYLVYGFFK